MKVETFAENVKEALGDLLVTFAVYGSAAESDPATKYSDVNTLIVARNLDMGTLDLLADAMASWAKAGQPAPTLFTLDRLKRSVDVFPIEIHDIKERHKVLVGEDALAEIAPTMENLRFQVEHELKGKLIQLRNAYLMTQRKPKLIAELLARSVSTFQLLFRAALRLHAPGEAVDKKEAPRALAAHVEFDFAAFEEAQGLKEGRVSFKTIDSRGLFERFLKAVETVADAVDDER